MMKRFVLCAVICVFALATLCFVACDDSGEETTVVTKDPNAGDDNDDGNDDENGDYYDDCGAAYNDCKNTAIDEYDDCVHDCFDTWDHQCDVERCQFECQGWKYRAYETCANMYCEADEAENYGCQAACYDEIWACCLVNYCCEGCGSVDDCLSNC